MAAASSESVRVLILLSDQPQREILNRIRSENELRLQIAKGRYHDLSRQRFATHEDVARAREARDAIIVDTRRRTARESGERIRPQQQALEDFLVQRGAEVIHRYTITNMLCALIPSALLGELEKHPDIVEIALDEENEAHLEISAPALGAATFWNEGLTGSGESVAVLDSGVWAGHPAFTGRVINGIFVETNPTCSLAEKASPDDFQGHGTHVAGIVASAGTPERQDRLGVAFGLSTLYNLKVSCSAGRSFDSDILGAVEVALAQTPVAIVNNSNGGATDRGDDSFSRQIDSLVDTYDLAWINSGGNSGPEERTVTSPGIAYNVISVANADTHDTVNRTDDDIHISSSRGPTLDGRFKPDLAAPGTNIFSADFSSTGFVSNTGTSMAAPHIAGAAALLRQHGVDGRLQIKALLINTTDSTAWNSADGWGYANLGRAFAQTDNTRVGKLSNASGDYKLYRGTPTASSLFSASVAWNRFVRPEDKFLRDVDLYLFNAATSELIDQSISEIQNVEQVAAVSDGGDVVVKVRAADDGHGWNEPYALAISDAGFTEVRGPQLELTCQVPTTVATGSAVSVDCQITNSGDAPAVETEVLLGVSGLGVPPAATVGNIAPGATAQTQINIAAPARGNGFGLAGIAGSTTYGEDFLAVETYSSSLTGGVPCPYALDTPSANVVPGGATGTVELTTDANCAWTATSDSTWITFASRPSGVGSGELTVVVAPNPGPRRVGNLAIGTAAYQIVQESMAGPSINAVVNGASFAPGFSSASWVTIAGSQLSPTTRTWQGTDFSGTKLPTSLDGVSVLINGKLAYVYFISPTQLNVLAPDDVAIGPIEVQVTTPEGTSPQFTATKEPLSLAFFMFDPEGRKYVAGVHADGTFLGKPSLYPGLNLRPAKPGDIILLFGTGFGPTTPSYPASDLVPQPAPTSSPVRITIGGEQAVVAYAGLISAGLYQFNVYVPDLPNGDHGVVAETAGVVSEQSAFITVHKD